MTDLTSEWVNELKEDLRLAEILEDHADGSLRDVKLQNALSKRLRSRIEALSAPALLRPEVMVDLVRTLREMRAGTVELVPFSEPDQEIARLRAWLGRIARDEAPKDMLDDAEAALRGDPVSS